jgi:hypothetical protein
LPDMFLKAISVYCLEASLVSKYPFSLGYS